REDTPAAADDRPWAACSAEDRTGLEDESYLSDRRIESENPSGADPGHPARIVVTKRGWEGRIPPTGKPIGVSCAGSGHEKHTPARRPGFQRLEAAVPFVEGECFGGLERQRATLGQLEDVGEALVEPF